MLQSLFALSSSLESYHLSPQVLWLFPFQLRLYNLTKSFIFVLLIFTEAPDLESKQRQHYSSASAHGDGPEGDEPQDENDPSPDGGKYLISQGFGEI